MQPAIPNQEDRIIKIIEDLGDVNKAAYFEAIKAMFCQPKPILATFQVGVTKEFFEYFWSLKWNKEDLSEDQNEYFEQFQKFKVKFLDEADAPDLPTEPTLIILWNPPPDHPYMTTLIDKFIDFGSLHCLMIVGDVSLMLDLRSTPVWSNLQLLNCLVTMHDQSRSDTLFAELTKEHLAKSAGIPSFVLKLLRNKRAPEGRDPEFFWGIKPRDRRVRALAMKLFVFQDTRTPINVDWTYGGVRVIDLAQCCGCLVVDVSKSTIETRPNSVQHDYSAKIVVWPDKLISVFIMAHQRYIKDMPPKSTDVGWLLVEQITAQNMAKQRNDPQQTFGQRFPFLTNSCIANIKHEVAESYIIMPQVTVEADRLLPEQITMDDLPLQTTVHPEDFWEFVKHALVPNKPIVCRDKDSTLNWMVKLVDGGQQHILFIRLKHGRQQSQFYDVIDEMALSARAHPKDKAVSCRDIVLRESEKHGIKLTFIFGAISRTGVKTQFELSNIHIDKRSNKKFGALLVTHESYPAKVPKNVELVVLLRTGLVNLLGEANCNFIEEYNENTAYENRVMKAREARLKSAKDVENMLQKALKSKAHLFEDKFDVTCTVVPKSTSTESTTTTSGHVRPREGDEASSAEHVRKKQRSD